MAAVIRGGKIECSNGKNDTKLANNSVAANLVGRASTLSVGIPVILFVILGIL